MTQISVIIPVYNVREYLDECLDSVSAQTYSDYEVIMVDDGSTDGSAEICRRRTVADSRFRLVTKVNGGQSSARNKGLEVATGRHVAFVDSDDIIHPDFLSLMMKAMESGECAIAACGITRFSKRTPAVDIRKAVFQRQTPCATITEMLYQRGAFVSSACAKLFSREAIGDIRFKEGILYEDLDWTARVLEAMPAQTGIAVCDMPLYFYRKRQGSSIESFNSRRLDVLDVTRGIEERAQTAARQGGNDAAERLKAARDRRMSANFDMYMQLSKTGSGNPDARRECWRQIRRLRKGSLLNPRVRAKNKLGILLSLAGPGICSLVGAWLIDRLKS